MATQLAPTEGTAVALSPEAERFALRQRQARMFAASPLVPDHLRKGTPEQAMANCYIALTLAEAMGEVPLIVMQNIHVVSGKAGFASQYMIARANSSGIFKGRIDWRIDRSNPRNLSVTAFAFLKETGGEVSVTCDMEMATAEGWTKNPKYKTMPEVMLRYRSAAFLVRFYAPDVMLGYQTVDEVQDVVAAAGPDLNARPLTSSMLIEQASGEGAPAAEDAAIVEPDEVEEPQQGRRDEEHGDQHDGAEEEDSVHPGEALADDLIERLGAAKVMGDVIMAEQDLDKHAEAMREGDVARVKVAVANAKKAFGK